MTRICRGCQKPILGKYVEALGYSWHEEHFKCGTCGKQIDDATFRERGGIPYHVACYDAKFLPRCEYCQKPLVGQYLVDYWGTKFCPEHEDQFEKCAYCGRLTPGIRKGRKVTGEVIRCSTCQSRAVETFEHARPIFQTLVRWINRQGLRYNNLDLTIKLCTVEQLEEIVGGHGSGVLGAATRTTEILTNLATRTSVTGVAIQRGLPLGLFHGVAVHELGHAWLGVHEVVKLADWAEEGFCEVLAHRYYRSNPGPVTLYYARQIELNDDSVYGTGFREVAKIVQRVGFDKLLTTLQTSKALPVVN